MKLLSKMVLALCLFLSLPGFAVKATGADIELGKCVRHVRAYLEARNKRSLGGKWLELGDLRQGNVIIHPTEGLVTVAFTAGETLHFHRPGEEHFPPSSVRYHGPLKCAYASSTQAIELTKLRTANRFEHPENFPLLFAFQAIHSRSISLSTIRSINATTAEPYRRPYTPTPLHQEYDRILKSIEPTGDFVESYLHWGNLFNSSYRALVGQDLLGKDALYPNQAKYLEGFAAEVTRFRRFVVAVYEATGEDLVRTGIIHSHQFAERPFTDFPSFPDLKAWAPHSGRPRPDLVGGVTVSVPADIYIEVTNDNWAHGIDVLREGNDPAPHQWRYSGPGFLDGEMSRLDPLSLSYKTFQATLEPSALNPYFERRHAEIAAFLQSAATRTNSILQFVGIPSSQDPDPTNPKDVSRMIARTLEARFGIAQSSVELIWENEGSQPQIKFPWLYSRLVNIGKRKIRVTGNATGVDFVLVDGKKYTGTTLQSATSALIEAGARSVHMLTLFEG